MIKLLPCPFCGNKNVKITYCEEGCCGSLPIFVECECGVMLSIECNTDTQAIKLWNKRSYNI